MDGAVAAVGAEEAELVDLAGAVLGVAQALRQEQQPPRVGDGGQSVGPGLVREEDGGELAVAVVQAGLRHDGVGMAGQFGQRKRRHGAAGQDVLADDVAEALPVAAVGRQAVLGARGGEALGPGGFSF